MSIENDMSEMSDCVLPSRHKTLSFMYGYATSNVVGDGDEGCPPSSAGGQQHNNRAPAVQRHRSLGSQWMGMDADVHTNEPRTSPRLSYLSRLLSSTMSDKRASYAENSDMDAAELEPEQTTVCDLKFHGQTQIMIETQPKKITIDDINDQQTFAKLREFSRQEHTEESFDFLARVLEYRKNPTIDEAHAIVNNFIRPSSVHAVNISWDCCEDLLHRYQTLDRNQSPPPSFFDDAFEEIKELVKHNILVRYNSQTSAKRTVILKPSQFRKVMLGIISANICCFILLAILVCCTYLFMYLHTVQTTTSSIIVGEAHESNSVANLLIRGYAYSGDPEYLKAHQNQVEQFNSELDKLRELDGDYSVTDETQQAIANLTKLENQIIYWRRDRDNQTAAVSILLSKEYNDTVSAVDIAIKNLQIHVLQEAQAQSYTVQKCTIAGMVIVILALLYSLPSALVLLINERRHTQRMVRLTQLLEQALKESNGSASSSPSEKSSQN